MSDADRYYETLELRPGASLEEIKRAYRELCQVWHPDRFADKPHLQARAHEKLAAINEAYRELLRRAPGGGRDDAAADGDGRTRSEEARWQAGGAARPGAAAAASDGPAADRGPAGGTRAGTTWPRGGSSLARAHAWVVRHAPVLAASLLTAGLLPPLQLAAGALALACIAVRWQARRPTRRRERLEVAAGLGAAAVLLTWGIAATLFGPRPGELASIDGRLRLRTVAIGETHACGVDDAGVAYCWGANFAGQLGRAGGPLSCIGAAGDPVPCAPRPERIAGEGRYAAVVTGIDHTCALDRTGAAWCWGAGFAGQRGDGSTADAAEPRRVATDARFVALSALGQHTCGLTADGVAYCWGSDTDGQLGEPLEREPCRLGSTSFACGRRPVRVPGGPWRAIAAGGSHTCALAADGAAYCWGSNRSGQLGSPAVPRCRRDGVSYPCAVHPVAVEGGRRFTRIAAGAAHTCALTADGAAYCWGRNDAGQLGIGSTVGAAQPTRIPGVAFTDIAAGGFHTCGLAPGGRVLCWGRDADGELRGNAPAERCGDVACRTRPAPADLTRARTIAAGFAATCALAEDFQGCWGRDDFGQLGAGRVDAAAPRDRAPRPGTTLGRLIADLASLPHRLLWRVRSTLEHAADRIQRPQP
ncbi:MAG: DnaJ domain-containing protein [Gemmatimonadetes bacterium]|nr:DnaJ domain-containing protein [Gemmatimonadota bacterium]